MVGSFGDRATSALAVSVISPEPVIEAGLRALLEAMTGLSVLPGTSGLEAAPGADLVVYDLVALQQDGPAVLRRLVGLGRPAVLGLTRRGMPELTATGRRLGVVASFLPSVEPSQLEALVRAAGVAGPVAVFGGSSSRGAVLPAEHRLSPRQLEVLGLIAAGLSNEDIARELLLSINTVKTYIRTAYRELGLTTRAQAVRWFLLEKGVTVRSPVSADPAPRGQTGRPRPQTSPPSMLLGHP